MPETASLQTIPSAALIISVKLPLAQASDCGQIASKDL